MAIVLRGRTTIPVRCPDLSPLFLALTQTPGVGGYSSHFGTRQSAAVMRTRYIIQVLSFHILAHSFALFCTSQESNPFLFNRFRTLHQKTPRVGVPCGSYAPCFLAPSRISRFMPSLVGRSLRTGLGVSSSASLPALPFQPSTFNSQLSPLHVQFPPRVPGRRYEF